jgi:hypothetical protein
MASQLIPTTPQPDTTIRVVLGSNVYSLRIVWSQRGEVFRLWIADSAGVPLLDGLRMVTMYPLLVRFHYKPELPAGELWFIDERNQAARPTLQDMGTRFTLYYAPNGYLD